MEQEKLKTFDEILDWRDGITENAIHLELKEEAIKWLKLLEEKDDNINNSYMNGFCLEHYKVDECLDTLGLSWAECSDISAVKLWIKHFFNINDEELKCRKK